MDAFALPAEDLDGVVTGGSEPVQKSGVELGAVEQVLFVAHAQERVEHEEDGHDPRHDPSDPVMQLVVGLEQQEDPTLHREHHGPQSQGSDLAQFSSHHGRQAGPERSEPRRATSCER